MDTFDKVESELMQATKEGKKVWLKPELEMVEIKDTEYWRFDESGDFPIRVWEDS